MQYDDGTYVGGSWYIGYYIDDLTGQAYQRDDEANCYWNKTQYFWIRAIDTANYTFEKLPDIDNITDSLYAWGLNFDITVEADLTTFLTEVKDDFATLIGMQFAFDFLMEAVYSNRNNENKRFNKDKLLLELKGTDANKTIGLEYKLNQAYKEMDFDLSALGSAFMPTKKRLFFTDL